MWIKNLVLLLAASHASVLVVLAYPLNDKSSNENDKYKTGLYFSVRKPKLSDDPYKSSSTYLANSLEADSHTGNSETKVTDDYTQNTNSKTGEQSNTNAAQDHSISPNTNLQQQANAVTVQNSVPEPYIGQQPHDYQTSQQYSYPQQTYNNQKQVQPGGLTFQQPQYQTPNQQYNNQIPVQVQQPFPQQQMAQPTQQYVLVQPNQVANQQPINQPAANQNQQYVIISGRSDISQPNQIAPAQQQSFQQPVTVVQGQSVNQGQIMSMATQTLPTQNQPATITLVTVPQMNTNEQGNLQTQFYTQQQSLPSQTIVNGYGNQNQPVPQQINVPNNVNTVPVTFGTAPVTNQVQGTLIAVPVVQQQTPVSSGTTGNLAVAAQNLPNQSVAAPAPNLLSSQQIVTNRNQGGQGAVYALVPVNGQSGNLNTGGNSQVLLPVQQMGASQLITVNSGR